MNEHFPDCSLIKEFKRKAHKQKDSHFNYIEEFNKFIKIVKKDVPKIHLYSLNSPPHDEFYHLMPLFHCLQNYSVLS
jgi:hypothetical protein